MFCLIPNAVVGFNNFKKQLHFKYSIKSNGNLLLTGADLINETIKQEAEDMLKKQITIDTNIIEDLLNGQFLNEEQFIDRLCELNIELDKVVIANQFTFLEIYKCLFKSYLTNLKNKKKS